MNFHVNASRGILCFVDLHPGMIFVNNLLDAQFLITFIYILYMFLAAMCPSSGELIVSVRHLVCHSV